MKVNLAYGSGHLPIEVPDDRTTVIEPAHIDGLADEKAAVLDAPISKKVGLRTFARVTVRRDADGRLHAFPAGAQGSHVAHSLALADGLAHLPADWDAAPAGATVAFQRWGGPSG